jgi:integrase
MAGGLPIFSHSAGKPISKAPTLAEYLRRTVGSDQGLRASSKRHYLAGIRNHVEGTALGETPVDQITPEAVAGYYRKIEGHGVRRNVHLLLSKAFNKAVLQGLIATSPLKRAGIRQPSKRRRTEVVPLTVPEIERLADHARNTRDRLAILLMAYAGLRAGEVAGLRVQDVNFAKSRLSIRQQVTQEGGVTELKTQAAARTITVERDVVDELRALVPGGAADGRLFHGSTGGFWPSVRVNEAVHRAAEAAGMPATIHAHMLRHTAVSLLIDDGANAKAIQRFVGHSTISETYDTYGHLFDEDSSALAQSMTRRRRDYRENGG